MIHIKPIISTFETRTRPIGRLRFWKRNATSVITPIIGTKELANGVLGSTSVIALLAIVRPSPKIGKNSTRMARTIHITSMIAFWIVSKPLEAHNNIKTVAIANTTGVGTEWNWVVRRSL